MPRAASDTPRRRDFHSPLPQDLYHALQLEAAQARRPANALSRDAIAQWIERQRQARIDQAILDYAEAVAGIPEDLDPDLEAAAPESWEERMV